MEVQVLSHQPFAPFVQWLRIRGSMDQTLNRYFTYHAPKSNQPERYEKIRSEGKKLSETIITNCPSSKERDIAIEKIREAVMWTNASIACNE